MAMPARRQGTRGGEVPPAAGIPRTPRFIVAAVLWLAAAAVPSSLPARPRIAEPERAAAPRIAAETRVTRLAIDLRLEPDTGLLRETASVTVTGRGVASLSFRLRESLVVERLRAASGSIEYQKAGDEVRVLLDPALDGERTLTFEISGRPRRGDRDLVNASWAALDATDLWYPTLDVVWADCEVRIRAPKGWVAVGPGSRPRGAPEGSWVWKANRPVRSVAVGAAPDLALGESIAVGLPIRTASPAGGPVPAKVAATLSGSLAWFADALAPFPFDGMNVVFLPGLFSRFQGSGVVVAPLGTPLGNASDGADLVAGQWYGERIAGDGAWIDAFAAWHATVFARDRGMPLPSELVRLREAYLALPSSMDVAIARADRTSPAEVLRGKGSVAPEMIRLWIGDSPFFEAVRDLFDLPVGPPVSLREIRSLFEKRASRNLTRPFSDWFERSGAPEFEARLRTMPSATGGFRVDVTLRQKRGDYLLPVELLFLGPGKEHREILEIDQATTTRFFVVDFEPARLELDPLGKIFRVLPDDVSVQR